jgi:hypothetical protein
MFGAVSKLPSFVSEPNPTYIRLTKELVDEDHPPKDDTPSRTLLVHSGQPLNDIFKYLPNKHNSRLAILESTLKWRHIAPTAPDTLWCHPYLDEDPFIMKDTPDIYVVGGQRRFGTRLVEGEDAMKRKIRCRAVMVPNFARTGTLVLVNLRSLEVKCVNFGVQGMTGGGGVLEEEGMCDVLIPDAIVLKFGSSEAETTQTDSPACGTLVFRATDGRRKPRAHVRLSLVEYMSLVFKRPISLPRSPNMRVRKLHPGRPTSTDRP